MRSPSSVPLMTISEANSIPVVCSWIRSKAARETPRSPQWKSPTGARKNSRPIADSEAYRQQLSARRDPVAGTLQQITARARSYRNVKTPLQRDIDVILKVMTATGSRTSYSSSRYMVPPLNETKRLADPRGSGAAEYRTTRA